MAVLPIQTIKEMVRIGCISGIDPEYINPGSLDMPASSEAYRLEKTFMPNEDETVRSLLEWAGASKHDLRFPLEVGVSYLVRLEGSVQLLESVYAYANPKSTTGRLNVLVRVIADGVPMYDSLPKGWNGEVWMLVQPRSFPILLAPGLPLAQVRFFDGKAFLDEIEMGLAVQEHGIFFNRSGEVLPLGRKRSHPDHLYMSIRADEGRVGWVCAGSNKPLDLTQRHIYHPKDFSFEPVIARGGEVVLHPGNFYILTTDEFVRVPPECSAELRAVDERLGEFRVHAAGFIDAGWGCGKDMEKKGQPITLEITTSEVGRLSLRHGQPIARIRFERMREKPNLLYEDVASNYLSQDTARLSKHFVIE